MRNLLLAIGVGLLLTAAPALAGHGGDPISVQRTYEVGPIEVGAVTCIGNPQGLTGSCDPTGQTQDGSIDVGGAIFTADDLPDGVDAFQATIVDDIWGPDVVSGDMCTDEDGNDVCGETDKGEVEEEFCGSSSVVSIPPVPNFDSATVFVEGPQEQTTNGCSTTAAPTGATTGGVLNPNGGIFITFQ